MFKLTSHLPYLINRAGACLAEHFMDELATYGVTLPMWRVMAALLHCDGQRVGQLAEMTSIEVSTLSRLLGAMERQALVRRERSREDARNVLVELTESGAQLTNRVVPRALYYEEVALRNFSPAEARALKALLVRVFDNLRLLDQEAKVQRRRA